MDYGRWILETFFLYHPPQPKKRKKREEKRRKTHGEKRREENRREGEKRWGGKRKVEVKSGPLLVFGFWGGSINKYGRCDVRCNAELSDSAVSPVDWLTWPIWLFLHFHFPLVLLLLFSFLRRPRFLQTPSPCTFPMRHRVGAGCRMVSPWVDLYPLFFRCAPEYCPPAQNPSSLTHDFYDADSSTHTYNLPVLLSLCTKFAHAQIAQDLTAYPPICLTQDSRATHARNWRFGSTATIWQTTYGMTEDRYHPPAGLANSLAGNTPTGPLWVGECPHRVHLARQSPHSLNWQTHATSNL